MAGLDPAISIQLAMPCTVHRDCRVIGELSDAVLRTVMPGSDDVGYRSRDAIASESLSRTKGLCLERTGGFCSRTKEIREAKRRKARTTRPHHRRQVYA